MSEMTTAEMVRTLRTYACGREVIDAIAARLSALDKELTAATARAEKAEAELQILRGVPVSIDTPHEVCDGIVSAPLAQIIADYGVEALAWIMDASQERADYETWSSRCVKAEAELLQVRTTGHAEAIGRFIRIAERLDDYYMGGNNLRDTLQNIVGDANDAANYARTIVLCVHKRGNQ